MSRNLFVHQLNTAQEDVVARDSEMKLVPDLLMELVLNSKMAPYSITVDSIVLGSEIVVETLSPDAFISANYDALSTNSKVLRGHAQTEQQRLPDESEQQNYVATKKTRAQTTRKRSPAERHALPCLVFKNFAKFFRFSVTLNL
jgi:hypothetical protein